MLIILVKQFSWMFTEASEESTPVLAQTSATLFQFLCELIMMNHIVSGQSALNLSMMNFKCLHVAVI